jgi:hypothetical protein
MVAMVAAWAVLPAVSALGQLKKQSSPIQDRTGAITTAVRRFVILPDIAAYPTFVSSRLTRYLDSDTENGNSNPRNRGRTEANGNSGNSFGSVLSNQKLIVQLLIQI